MLVNRLIVVVACVMLGISGQALAGGDIAAGKAKAAKCASCHGADGAGKKANPPLAGMNVEAHIKAMQDYRSGSRKHAVMKMLAKKLSDQDVADIAVYYASLE